MRFLSTAKKEDETTGEKMVRANKRDSVYLFSPVDFKSQRQRRRVQLISPLRPLTESSSEEEEGKEEVEEEKKRLKEEGEEEEEHYDIKEVSPINEKTIVKPIFRYMPNEVEIRLLFNQVLRGEL